MLLKIFKVVPNLIHLTPRSIFLPCVTLLNPVSSVYRRLLYHQFDSVQVRENPVIMKLDSPEFKAIFTPELNSLSAVFVKYGYPLRIAGGAVRDLLLGLQPKDLDFATTATPDQMKEMFMAENIRMINMKGEKHGTITARINDKENFEVTTLRVDLSTDGRHAQVFFTKDWLQDAVRRDLTINSMYLDLDGTVYDYFHGYEDLMDRKVIFVRDPAKRIKEDYLRILRYFRFYGRISRDPNSHDEKTLEAISSNMDGLERISGERIWTELRMILQNDFAGELIKTMLSLGMAPYIGLPEAPDVDTLQKVWMGCHHLKPNAVTLLVTLLKNQEEVMVLHARLKLSAYERDLGLFVVLHRDDKPSVKPLRPYQLLVLRTRAKVSDTHEWVAEVLKYRGDTELLEEFQNWELPKFPLNGNMLREKGVPGGRPLGLVMQRLRESWAEADFHSTTEELLQQIPDILTDLRIERVEPKR